MSTLVPNLRQVVWLRDPCNPLWEPAEIQVGLDGVGTSVFEVDPTATSRRFWHEKTEEISVSIVERHRLVDVFLALQDQMEV